jgi:DDE superfamily endonuclease
MSTSVAWEHELQSWLEPFLSHLHHPARRRMCPLYVAGLIGPGDRKSLQPMAARVAPADYDQLHHFVAIGPWDEAPLEAELLAQANRLVGGPDAILVIDDTALLKKGTHSVGVASQYAGVVGKNANSLMFVVNELGRGSAIPGAGAGRGRMERLRRAGGRAVKTTVEQTLMRGLVTAFPCVRPGLPRSVSERR